MEFETVDSSWGKDRNRFRLPLDEITSVVALSVDAVTILADNDIVGSLLRAITAGALGRVPPGVGALVTVIFCK